MTDVGVFFFTLICFIAGIFYGWILNSPIEENPGYDRKWQCERKAEPIKYEGAVVLGRPCKAVEK